MKNDDQNKTGSKGDNVKSKLTTEEALWLTAVRTPCIAFIKERDEKLTWEDAEDIFSHQLQVLSERGFEDLYSKKTRLAIQRGHVVSHEEKMALLRYHLDRRMIDFFRKLRTLKSGYVRSSYSCGEQNCECPNRKGGYHRIRPLSDYEWSILADEDHERDVSGNEIMMALNEVFADAWPFLGKTYRAIIRAAKRYPAGGFNPTCLYEAMMEHEHGFFLPKDGAFVVNEKEFVRKAIARRTAELRRKLRNIVADEPGRLDFF